MGSQVHYRSHSLRQVRLFVAWVQGQMDVAKGELARGDLEEPVVRELLLMVHLFAGYPRQLAALAQVASVCPRVLRDEGPQEGTDVQAGDDCFRRVYGNHADRVQAVIRERSPSTLLWVLDHAYGRVLRRPGLDLRSRELAAVGALTSLQTWPQLDSHVLGAFRCGATFDQLAEAIRATEGMAPPDALTRALDRLESAQSRWSARGPDVQSG